MEKPPFEDEPLDKKTADEERQDARGYQSQQFFDELERLEIEVQECVDIEKRKKLLVRFKQVQEKYREIQQEMVMGMLRKKKEP